MFDLSRICRIALCAAMLVAGSGCGLAEMGFTQAISAAQRAKQAKGGVDSEKEAKKKIEEAMERAALERAKATGEMPVVKTGNPSSVEAEIEAAMRATMKSTEEQTK